MTVLSILKEKGRGVVTVRRATSLLETCRILTEHKIGAAVVLDAQNRLCGIVSERDIVRLIARDGAEALAYPVGECMTGEVSVCHEQDSIQTVMAHMTAGRFRHMPVVDAAGLLVGIVSIGDVVREKIAEIEQDALAMRHYIASV